MCRKIGEKFWQFLTSGNLKRKELGMIRKVLVSAWSLDSEHNVSFEGNYKEKEVNIMFQHKTSTELC